MLRLLAPVLLLVLVAPLAAAQETLASLEEPHRGTDIVFPVTVTQEEADKARALIYRNNPGVVFGLVIYDSSGAEVFVRNGSRGVQTLPALAAGEYRFFIRGTGEFQATDKAFERIIQGNRVSSTLRGTDAYVLAPSRPYTVNITGEVEVEWWDLTGLKETLAPPVSREAKQGGAYVITLRGAADAPYDIALDDAGAPAPSETPLAPWLALAALALLALARRRRA